jgi:Ubiquitin-protein ligase
LLQRHTRYSGGLNEDSPRVKFLWQVLKELSETEKLRFVKFCWGQERLPANDEEFERTQTRFMIKPATYATNNPNTALPKADTCFFNLELPNYSSKEILKERLLLAINTDCDSINADQLINLDPNAHHHHDRYSEFEEVPEDEDDE